MTKLKILLACEQPLPSERRAGRPNYTVEYLSRAGHDITVVCPRPADRALSSDGRARYSYLREEFQQFSLRSRLSITRSMRRAIEIEAKNERFDVVRANSVVPCQAALRAIGGRTPVYGELTDFPTDLYAEFDMPLRRIALSYLARMERFVANNVDFASVDTPVRRDYWAACGLAKGKVAVIPNGVDTKHFSPRERSGIRLGLGFKEESGPIIVYHGDIGKYDGVDNLIRAMGMVTQDARLLVIGVGPDKIMGRLKSVANDLGLDDRVSFTGWVDYSALPDYLSVARVGVAPFIPRNRQNASVFHAKIKEYISMQMIFVATETPGLRSMVGDLPIYLHDPGNLDELADRLTFALGHAKDATKLSQEKNISKQIDWGEIIGHDEAFMVDIANNQVEVASKYDLIPVESNQTDR